MSNLCKIALVSATLAIVWSDGLQAGDPIPDVIYTNPGECGFSLPGDFGVNILMKITRVTVDQDDDGSVDCDMLVEEYCRKEIGGAAMYMEISWKCRGGPIMRSGLRKV